MIATRDETGKSFLIVLTWKNNERGGAKDGEVLTMQDILITSGTGGEDFVI